MSKSDLGVRAQLVWLQTQHLQSLRQLRQMIDQQTDLWEVANLTVLALKRLADDPSPENREHAYAAIDAYVLLARRFTTGDNHIV